jgi:hypothetical protein
MSRIDLEAPENHHLERKGGPNRRWPVPSPAPEKTGEKFSLPDRSYELYGTTLSALGKKIGPGAEERVRDLKASSEKQSRIKRHDPRSVPAIPAPAVALAYRPAHDLPAILRPGNAAHRVPLGRLLGGAGEIGAGRM